MDLSHIGANRKEVRKTAFSDKAPEIGVDAKTGNLILSVHNASGLGTKGQYNYTVVLTPVDLASLLKVVSSHRSALN